MGCQGNTSLLTTINGRVRRIDLFCKLMAPAIFGIVTQYLGDTPQKKIQYGASWIMIWNVIGLFIEYYFIRTVYKSNPILATHSLKGDDKPIMSMPKRSSTYGSVAIQSDGNDQLDDEDATAYKV